MRSMSDGDQAVSEIDWQRLKDLPVNPDVSFRAWAQLVLLRVSGTALSNTFNLKQSHLGSLKDATKIGPLPDLRLPRS